MKLTSKACATALATIGIFGVSPGALAKDWSLDLSAGATFDDRVTAGDNLDQKGTSDVGAVFDIDAGYKLVNSDENRLEIGYEFNQTIYGTLSNFDYQEHTGSISGWTKSLGGAKLGLSYEYVHALLGGDEFLNQHIVSPSLATDLSDDMQLTLAYRYTNKDYRQAVDNARDGETHQGGADIHIYSDKSRKGYFMFGGGYTVESTDGTPFIPPPPVGGTPATDPFSYKGFYGRAAWQTPIEVFGMPGRLRLSYNYQMREYDDRTSLTPPVAGKTRHDNRQTLRGYADAEITDDLKFYVDYRHMDRGSNLDSADYKKNVLDVGLKYSF